LTVDATDDLADRVVAESDVLKDDVTAHWIEDDGLVCGFLADLRFGVENFEHALRRADGTIDHAGQEAKLLQRHNKHAHVKKEGDKLAGGHGRVSGNLQHTGKGKYPDRDGEQAEPKVHQRPVAGPDAVNE